MRFSKIHLLAVILITLLFSFQKSYSQLVVKNSAQNEILRITQDGFLGLATTAPQSLLHVKGNTLVDQGSLIVQKNSADVFKCRQDQNEATTLFTVSANGNVSFGMATPAPPGTSYLTVKGLSSAGGTGLVVDANGNVFKTTSSIRYKKDIAPLEDDFTKILQLQPIRFKYLSGQETQIGYTAEALDQIGLKHLVYYNDAGQPESIYYDKLIVYLLEVVKMQQREIHALKNKLSSESSQR